MRRSTVIACLVVLLVPSLVHAAGTPVHQWSKAFGGPGDDFPNSVATAADGSLYVTGGFTGTINLGGNNLVSAGGDDGFLVKYDANGNHVWSMRFGDTANDWGTSVSVDPNGNVIMAGTFLFSINLGGSTLTSPTSKDVFLAKFNAIGAHQWSQRFGGANTDGGMATTDGSGNIILAGNFVGSASFGGATFNSAGGWDLVLAKFNSAGVHQWSQRFGSTSDELPSSVTADAAGNVIVGGWFLGTSNFGGSSLMSAGAEDAFLAKYSPTGVHLWSKRFGSVGIDVIYGVTHDSSNNIVIGGYFNDTVSFGGSNLVSAGSQDAFFAKYNPSGIHTWSLRQGSTGWDAVTAVAVGPNGDVFSTGWFEGSVFFGSTTLVDAGVDADMYVARTSAAGVPLWVTQCAGPNDDGGYCIAVSGLDDVCVGGLFQTPEITVANIEFPGVGAYDALVTRWKMNTGEPRITSITDVGNDQGRKVMIRFVASGADASGVPSPITNYVALRRNDAPPAMQAGDTPGALADGWVEVASVKAFANQAYLIEAPTIGDSTLPLGPYLSVFKIRAASSTPSLFYDSPPDSGASVDNLAPGIPGSFAYASGNLTWDESEDEDFDFFTVYGSNTNSFGSATLVDYSVAPAMNVSASPYVFYFVTATDFNGNEGKPATVNSLSGVGGTPTSYVLSVSNYPNPFNPRTTIGYTAPSSGKVKVQIYDARGAIVKTLFEGPRVAGAYSIDWDGRADNGDAVASGLYFARIEHNGATRTKKMVLLK